jgi:hypothetical protein
LDIAVQQAPIADGFPDGFFRRKADGEMLGGLATSLAVRNLLRSIDALQKPWVSDLFCDAVDFNDIDANVHGRPPLSGGRYGDHSTVTLLARFRG